ncbi:MAG TPA: TetR/AcrR family transcriptional regulator, partial [Myxococcota bacterium]|nr:TetR/AcrR family transcriptional regulator [Myxococcota bacterium]
MSTPPEPTFQAPRIPEHRPGRPGGKRDVNRQARLDALCRSALALMLERGVDSVTVDEIARHAGLSKAGFYRYFNGPTELMTTALAPMATAVDELAARIVAALEAALDTEGLTLAYQQLAAGLLAIILHHPEGTRLYLQERFGPPSPMRAPILDLARRVLAIVTRMTRASRAHGLMRDVDVDMTARVVSGAAHEVLGWYLRGELPIDPAGAVEVLIDVTMWGVRERPP